MNIGCYCNNICIFFSNIDTALMKYGKTYDPKTNTIHDTQSVFVAIKPNSYTLMLIAK